MKILVMMEEVLCVTRSEMEELRVARLRLANSTRPAVGLPSEILGLVFEMACFSNTHPLATPEEAYGPILLDARHAIISICSKWRKVAFSTTSLWARISVTGDIWRPSYHTLNAIIERAGGRPVELYMDIDLDRRYRLDKMLPFVLRVASRCRVLSLVNDNRFRTADIGIFQSGTAMPHLHTLILHYEAIGNIDLSIVSSLRNVSMDTIRGNIQHRLHLPSVSGIVKLSMINCIDPTDAILAINSCPHLETLRWRCSVPNYSTMRLPTLVPPRCLVHLRLKGKIPLETFKNTHLPNLIRLRSIPDVVLNNLRLPQLRHIHICDTELDQSCTVVPAFISSHPDIKEIVLDGPLCMNLAAALNVGRAGYPNLTDVWIDCPAYQGYFRPVLQRVDELLAKWNQHGSSWKPLTFHVGGISTKKVSLYPEVVALQSKYVDGGHAVVKVEDYDDAFWYWESYIQ